MNTLHLTLKKQWFDMIQMGEKKEEYREIRWYWVNRPMVNVNLPNGDVYFTKGFEEFRKFTHIRFTNGYSKNSPSFTIQCNGIRIGRGNPEWGAPTDRDVFILSLGKIIEQ